jgi:hypothetical protein
MKHIAFLLIFSGVSMVLIAQSDFAQRKKHYNIDAAGLALQGYDAVSYLENNPTPGNPTIYLFYKGVKYQFASPKHLEQFRNNPSLYEPMYGGWCAYAMGKTGDKVAVDPTKFKIVNGHICLFYYSIINNTLEKWNRQEGILTVQANQNWMKTLTY